MFSYFRVINVFSFFSWYNVFLHVFINIITYRFFIIKSATDHTNPSVSGSVGSQFLPTNVK